MDEDSIRQHGTSCALDQIRESAALPPHDARKGDSQPEDLTQPEAEDSSPRSKVRIALIMGALFLALFLAALDATIVSTAIPTICSHFHSAAGYTWIGGAYLLTNAAAGPIWAKLSDIWGRKPILLAAVAVFFLSSIVCATSTSMGMLIAGRAVQGAAGGGLMLLVNITVSDLFSMRERTLFLGLLEFVWATASAIGPIIGGVLAQLVSWRWIWYINLPASGLTFIMISLYLDVHNPRTKILEGVKAIDWVGSVSIVGLTLMTLLGLDFGGDTFPWNSPRVICLIVFGLLMSILFFFSEVKLAKYPLVPLSLFREKSNVASIAVGFIHGFVFISAEYYLPLYFQSVQQASPVRSGLMILPFVVTEALLGITSGLLIHRTGRYRELIWVGTTFLTLGFGLLISLNARSTLATIIPFEIVAGFGSGMLFEPPLISLQTLVTQENTASGTATFSFVRSLALCLSVVVGGVVFQNGMQMQRSNLVGAGLTEPILSELSGTQAAANVMVIGDLRGHPAQQAAVKHAFAWSLRNCWIMFTCVSACSVVASAFISKQVLRSDHTETRTGLREKRGEREGEEERAGIEVPQRG